jgi:plastocyanin
MRKLIAILVVAAVPAAGLAAAGASASDDPPVTKAATRTITLGDNFFKPKAITIRKGTILKFNWGPDNTGTEVEHNVTGVKGNKFDSTEDTTRPSRPFRKRFTRNSLVVCTIHPTTMKLRVTVK